jgi:uncharacterized protein (DUF305 family)
MPATRLITAALGALLAGATITGCATQPTDPATTEQHATPTPTPSASTAPNGEKFNEADVAFAQMMAVHHSGAMSMAAVILGKEDVDPQVTELAQQIMDAQGPEIATMNGWLEEWGVADEPMSDMSGMDHSTMDLGPLEDAAGEDASRMFLEDMIVHHQDAIDMSQTQVESGANDDAIALAEKIIEDQQAEIDLMEQMLSEL